MKRGIIVLIVLFLVGGLIYFVQAKTNDIEVHTDLFPLSKELRQGDQIKADTRIDTHQDMIVDVTINYAITNNKGLPVFQKSKTLAVEKTAKVTDYLMIHKSLGPGPYLVEVGVNYEGASKVERDTFNVVAESAVATEPTKITFSIKEETLLLIILIILICYFLLLFIQNMRLRKLFRGLESRKIDIKELMSEK